MPFWSFILIIACHRWGVSWYEFALEEGNDHLLRFVFIWINGTNWTFLQGLECNSCVVKFGMLKVKQDK